MSLLAVTVLGHDRPGIVAETTAALAALGGNLEDSTMTLLRGHFAMLLLVTTDAGPDDVSRALAGLAADGSLSVDVRAVPGGDDGDAAGDEGLAFVLRVHGADRAGIVSGLTGVVAAAGGSVVDLTTRLSGELYVLLAELRLAPGTDVGALEAAVRHEAGRLGVDASLQPLDTDDL